MHSISECATVSPNGLKADNLKTTFIAFFESLRDSGQNVPLSTLLEGIKGPRWAGQIKRLRRMGRGAKGFDRCKRSLPAFMLSATTNGGHKAADVANHSGLLQVDLDHVGKDQVEPLRDRIGEDRHILAAWISPSGDGVKAILLIPPDIAGHKAAFETASIYMRDFYCQEIDSRCSDISRLCFVSHDPAIVVNADAVAMPVSVLATPSDEGHSRHSTTSLNPASASCVLPLHNSAFFDAYPGLRKHYQTLVVKRYSEVQPGMRNKILVDMVPMCLGAVAPEFVKAFSTEFYHQNARLFPDYPFSKWEAETRAHIRNCTRSFPGKLTALERKAYDALDDERQRLAFRICQSLSLVESDESVPPPLFFASYEDMGIRMNEFSMTAQRVMQKLQDAGIIALVMKGQLRARDVKAKASVWRWLL